MSSVIELERADAGDVEALLALREAAAVWLAVRGVHQWVPGEVSLLQISGQVTDGEWYVTRDGSSVAGALRLLWQDEEMWGPQPAVAAYVHGLVIDRRHAGTGLGVALLDWAGQQARRAGRDWLRLDCGEDNPALRGYYEREGFTVVGRRDFEGRGYAVVLLEKRPFEL